VVGVGSPSEFRPKALSSPPWLRRRCDRYVFLFLGRATITITIIIHIHVCVCVCTCRNAEKISAGTSAGPGVHQTVPGAGHGSGLGRGHGRVDTGVRDTPRPATLSGTGRFPTGPVRQGRRRRQQQREAGRRLPAVRRRPADMHRYDDGISAIDTRQTAKWLLLQRRPSCPSDPTSGVPEYLPRSACSVFRVPDVYLLYVPFWNVHSVSEMSFTR